MTVDPLSPIAPARIRALLVPVGRIKRSRFLALAQRLQDYNVVRLGDVSPDGRSQTFMTRNAFSPLAFPTGMIIYNLDISLPPLAHIDTFPFEPFREPFAIIAIADGTELSKPAEQEDEVLPNGHSSEDHPRPEEFEQLQEELNYLKAEYERSLIQHLFVFDYHGVDNLIFGPDRTIWIPPPEACRSTTIKTAMCDLTSSLLWEMNKFAEFISDIPMIDSPKITFAGPRRSVPNSASPALDKMQQRLKMSTQPPTRPMSTPPPGSESPKTFDDITRSIASDRAAPEPVKPVPSPRFSSPMGRDRVSLGTTPITEKMRQRIRGRRSIVLGTIYMQTGRWPDAVRDLAEGAAVARSNNDYLWHAKALECILICLVLFGWAGLDFSIPPIFYPMSDKSSHKSLLSPASSTPVEPTGPPANREVSLQNLVNVLPEVSNHILNLYSRATSMTDEPIPQLLYSETVIRLSHILCAINLRDGRLDDSALRGIVLNEHIKFHRQPERLRGVTVLSKKDIASYLFRALPPAMVDLPITDAVTILVGMSSVLTTLGMERKKAFILRELFSILVPGLVHARKVGAADMGVHPAAGLQVLNSTPFDLNALDSRSGDNGDGMRNLLSIVSGIYGVPTEHVQDPRRSKRSSFKRKEEKLLPNDSVEGIISQALQQAHLCSVGDLGLKTDILRTCINFCEALPDFQGVLQFTVDLLRTINTTPMLDDEGLDPSPAVPREEQIRLLANIQRTVAVAERFGSVHLEADYWDDFLIRGIEVSQASSNKELVKRTKEYFGISTQSSTTDYGSGKSGPFIYNPFAKKTEPKAGENLLIAGEPATFTVIFQNPFAFEVEIERLSLYGDGVELEGVAENIVLAPSCMQERRVTMTPKDSGTLTVTGCTAKIRCCRERKFPIFKKKWRPDLGQSQKVKRGGLAALQSRPTTSSQRPNSRAGAKPREDESGPVPSALEVKVLQPQPIAYVASTSLSQSALVVLEGETKAVTVTLENTSSCSVDFLFFTFQDSATRQIQMALQNKDLPAVDIYELEAQLMTHPPLSWQRRAENGGSDDPDKNVIIPPHSKRSFTLEVFGKPGLQDAVIQIDYGCAGSDKISAMPDTFYSRRIAIPISVTVNASIEIVRTDILPFSGAFEWATSHLSPEEGEEQDPSKEHPKMHVSDYAKIMSRCGKGTNSNLTPGGNDHCLLLLDLRNAWPAPISVSLDVLEDDNPDSKVLPPLTQDTERPISFTLKDALQPGQTTRFALPVPRLYIPNPARQIPSLNLQGKRQFVVSERRLSYDAELAIRETFWYRERLLRLLRCSWREGEEADGINRSWRGELERGRKGFLDMRNLRLASRLIDALRVDDLEIGFDLERYTPRDNDETDSNSAASQPCAGPSRVSTATFSVPPSEFLTLKVLLQNNSPTTPIHPLLRLQPSVRNQPHTHALDLSRRFAWTGMLQRALPILGPKEKTVVEIGITALCKGEFEVGASVEEVRVLPPVREGKRGGEEDNEGGHEGGDEDAGLSVIGGSLRSRRIWHSRVPCVVLAS